MFGCRRRSNRACRVGAGRGGLLGRPRREGAVTAFAALIVSVQTVPEPLQLPPQPANVAPEAGIAVSETVVFAAKSSEQSVFPLPQSIPAPVTWPLPVTDRLSPYCVLELLKVAVTFLAALIETTQVVAVPLQAPPQPVNVAPLLRRRGQRPGRSRGIGLAAVGRAVAAVDAGARHLAVAAWR